MRFLMMIHPNLADGEWAQELKPEDAESMMAFNEELTKAGVLLALDGLHEPSKGARVRFGGGRPTVTDGPFTEAKEVIGGYWIIQASSKEEAVEWATRIPAGEGDMVEVRQIQEFEDFTPEVQDVAQLSQDPPEQPAA